MKARCFVFLFLFEFQISSFTRVLIFQEKDESFHKEERSMKSDAYYFAQVIFVLQTTLTVFILISYVTGHIYVSEASLFSSYAPT